MNMLRAAALALVVGIAAVPPAQAFAPISQSEVYQAEQMDKLGMNVIPVPFRDAYAFGGGLHCATADVYREGTCQDYFPNQIADPTLV